MKNFENPKPQHVAIDRGDAAEFVVFAVARDALVNLRKVREHPFDKRPGKEPDVIFRRAELFDSFRPGAMVEIAPEMILERGPARGATFAHVTCAAPRGGSPFRRRCARPPCRDSFHPRDIASGPVLRLSNSAPYESPGHRARARLVAMPESRFTSDVCCVSSRCVQSLRSHSNWFR